MIVAWDFMETIHSRSYTYIMKNVYSNPTAVLDTIVQTPEIMARAVTVTESYDRFIEYAQRYHMTGKGSHKRDEETTLSKSYQCKHTRRHSFLCFICVFIWFW